jgi:hypothetical protein
VALEVTATRVRNTESTLCARALEVVSALLPSPEYSAVME